MNVIKTITQHIDIMKEGCARAFKTLTRRVEVVEVDKPDKTEYSVRSYIDGEIDCSYGYGPKEWAEQLAKDLVSGDCPKCKRHERELAKSLGKECW